MSIGCAKFEQIDEIISKCRKNFETLKQGLQGVKGIVLLEAKNDSKPSRLEFPQ